LCRREGDVDLDDVFDADPKIPWLGDVVVGKMHGK
jgi:hypothetical protein